MSASHLLIVNPHSGGGSTGRKWQELEDQLRAILPRFDAVLTQGPAHATSLAAGALGRYQVVVAAGGDGTMNEVVNGLIQEGGEAGEGVALGVLPLGTGSDFVRSLGMPDRVIDAASVLAQGRRRQVDIGRARLRALDGSEMVRYFANEAEVGMGAEVCRAVARSSRRFGGPAAYLWATLVTMLRYQDQQVSLAVDGAASKPVDLNNLWIANGSFSGGGILSAPQARLDDAALDLVCVRHASPLQRVMGLLKLRSGKFVELSQVDYSRVNRVEVVAETAVPVEVDGEFMGTVPATFDLVPAALTVIS